MLVFVVFRPGRDGVYVPAGVTDNESDAWDIVYRVLESFPGLTAYQCPIYQTPLNHHMQWLPAPPMPVGHKPRPDVVRNRVIDPANALLPHGVWW